MALTPDNAIYNVEAELSKAKAAAISGDLQSLESCIEHCKTIKNVIEMLALSIQHGHLNIVEYLLPIFLEHYEIDGLFDYNLDYLENEEDKQGQEQKMEQEQKLKKEQRKDQETLAHIAARYDRVDILKMLYDKKAELDIPNARDLDPWILAINFGSIKSVDFLYKNKLHLQKKVRLRDVPILNAAACNEFSVMKFLLDNHLGHLNQYGSEDLPPFLLAARYGSISVMEYLLKINPNLIHQTTGIAEEADDPMDADSSNPNALAVAVKYNRIEVVRWLASRYPELQDRTLNHSGGADNNPIALAVENNNPEMLRLLINYPINIYQTHVNIYLHLYFNNQPINALPINAFQYAEDQCKEILTAADRLFRLSSVGFSTGFKIKELIANGASVFQIDSAKKTPLHHSADQGKVDVFSELLEIYLESGKTLEDLSRLVDVNGKNPIQIAQDKSMGGILCVFIFEKIKIAIKTNERNNIKGLFNELLITIEKPLMSYDAKYNFYDLVKQGINLWLKFKSIPEIETPKAIIKSIFNLLAKMDVSVPQQAQPMMQRQPMQLQAQPMQQQPLFRLFEKARFYYMLGFQLKEFIELNEEAVEALKQSVALGFQDGHEALAELYLVKRINDKDQALTHKEILEGYSQSVSKTTDNCLSLDESENESENTSGYALDFDNENNDYHLYKALKHLMQADVKLETVKQQLTLVVNLIRNKKLGSFNLGNPLSPEGMESILRDANEAIKDAEQRLRKAELCTKKSEEDAQQAKNDALLAKQQVVAMEITINNLKAENARKDLMLANVQTKNPASLPQFYLLNESRTKISGQKRSYHEMANSSGTTDATEASDSTEGLNFLDISRNTINTQQTSTYVEYIPKAKKHRFAGNC